MVVFMMVIMIPWWLLKDAVPNELVGMMVAWCLMMVDVCRCYIGWFITSITDETSSWSMVVRLIFTSQSATSVRRWWVVHVEIADWDRSDSLGLEGSTLDECQWLFAAHRCTLAVAHAKVLAWRRSLESQGWVKGLWNDDMYPSIGRWTMANILENHPKLDALFFWGDVL